ncbi:MAG: hypothetical protein NTZ41_02330 [Sphingobacteriales bacterium]|nr:hypothetical protein [Sphingobacteriales bacterium]
MIIRKSFTRILSIFLLLTSLSAKAQLLPKSETKFTKVEIWETVEGNIFGKLISRQDGETTVKIFSNTKEDGIYTYCFLGGPYFGGEGGMLVKSTEKIYGSDGALIYKATCKDAQNRIVTMLFRYKDSSLIDVSYQQEGSCLSFTN